MAHYVVSEDGKTSLITSGGEFEVLTIDKTVRLSSFPSLEERALEIYKDRPVPSDEYHPDKQHLKIHKPGPKPLLVRACACHCGELIVKGVSKYKRGHSPRRNVSKPPPVLVIF